MIEKKSKDAQQPGKDSEPSFEELLEESFKKAPRIRIGDKIETRIVAMDKDNIYLDLGTRMEGSVKKAEYIENGKLIVKEGDTVTVHVVEKRGGAFQCARWFASAESIPADVQGESVSFALKDAFEHGVPVEGEVTQLIRGGFEVTIMGKRCFCPFSQIEKKFCENPDSHLQKTYKFAVIQLDEEDQNIVVSRREILLEEERKKVEKLWQKIEPGTVVEGVVANVQKYGAFVDIGGIQGLLHVSEISHSRIEDAHDVLEEGQTLEVEVISLDRDRNKIGLSLKSRMEDPWKTAKKELAVGDEVTGKVVKMKSFGAFIELLPGVVGLLHVSQLGSDKQHQHVKEVLKIGDTPTVRILEIDEKKQTISLTLELLDPDVSEELKKLRQDHEETLKSGPGLMEDIPEPAAEKEDE